MDEIDDGAALAWALGCVFACFRERVAMTMNLATLTRIGATVACLLFAATIAFPAALVISYRRGWTSLAESMQGGLPGDDISRFIPLIESTTNGQIALAIITIAALVSAAILVALNRRSGIWIIGGLAALVAAQIAIRHNDPVVQAVFTERELRTDYAQVAFLIALGAAAYWATRPRAGSAGNDLRLGGNDRRE